MVKKREDDTSQTPPREQQRCYSINGLWYFELRGGGQHGPYDSKQDMERALNDFIALHEEMKAKDR